MRAFAAVLLGVACLGAGAPGTARGDSTAPAAASPASAPASPGAPAAAADSTRSAARGDSASAAAAPAPAAPAPAPHAPALPAPTAPGSTAPAAPAPRSLAVGAAGSAAAPADSSAGTPSPAVGPALGPAAPPQARVAPAPPPRHRAARARAPSEPSSRAVEAVVPAAVDSPDRSGSPESNTEADHSEADRVAREIARTAMWIARATSLVPRTQNEKAAETLASAKEFQLGARDAYELKQYARAQRLTQAARDYADRAMRLAGPAVDDPEYVKTVLDHTDDALDRLKEYLDEGSPPATRRRYHELKDAQKKARALLDAGNAHDAYRATTGVREGVLEILVKAPPGRIPCESAKKAVENAQSSRDRVRDEIGKDPGGACARYLDAADQQLLRAQASLDRTRCRDAVLRAKAAERQLEKAIDASRKSSKR
jgi:hypothetical protein